MLAEQVIQLVKDEGVCVVPRFFPEAECARYVAILKGILQDRIERGVHFGSRTTQIIYNYFLYSPDLFPLILNPLIDAVMSELIDEDFVLISPSARNPMVRSALPEGQKVSGEGWHVDSRVSDKRDGSLYRPSMSYYAAVALESFTEQNAATHYVPRSHLLYKRPLDRNAALEHETLIAPAGSIVFFDSALWHRVGSATTQSRWSIFNMYGPWFMKPYFRFPDNYDPAQAERLPKEIRKVLHFTSTPPRNANEGLNTLSRP